MDSQLLTLSKIFTERLFRIPDYQRGYAWTIKQLSDFWNDLTQLDINHNHYTGVLTLEDVPDEIVKTWDDDQWIVKSKNYQAYYVVDGQQRLTTAIIMLQVIIERLKKKDKLNYTTSSEIIKRFIFESKDDGISRSYIFGYEKDNPSYEFLKTQIFCEESSTNSKEKTIYTHNLESAKLFFKQKIHELDLNELEVLYTKITQNLLFNIFTISDDVDVCVAFETMNNRGKALSYLELLKNRLIYLSLKFNEDEDEKTTLRKAINDCWKTIYHNLGRNKDNPLDDDEFLYSHYSVYYGEEFIEKSENQENLYFHRKMRLQYTNDLLQSKFITKNVFDDCNNKERITLSDIYHYVSSLQNSVDCWYQIYNPMQSSFSTDEKIWLDKLNRINFYNFGPLIMVAQQKVKEKSKRIELLKAIEKQLFSFSLLDISMSFFIQTNHWIKLAIRLNTSEEEINSIIKEISDLYTQVSANGFLETQIRNFKKSGFYKWDGIRYFLYEYNLSLQVRSKTERSKINWAEFSEHRSDYISVEHIYPQTARNKYWVSKFSKYTSSQRKILKNSLGNLLPLSKPKNSSLSNKPFSEKVDGTKDKVVGFRYGCYAENEVSEFTDWGAIEILERGIKMLEFMELRWNIKIGNKDAKIDFLGLSFLKKELKNSQLAV